MKAYTDLNQSKKLAEILPLESADMVYIKHSSSDNPTWEFNEDFPPMNLGGVSIKKIFAETLPCWSLAALLDVLPNYTLQTNTDGTVFVVCDSMKPMISDAYNNPVDACCEMIIKLNKQKIL